MLISRLKAMKHTCAPHPKPAERMADGADHDPSDLRATTRPVPSL